LPLLEVVRVSLLTSIQSILRNVIAVVIRVFRPTSLREELFGFIAKDDVLGSVYVRPFSRPLHAWTISFLFFRVILISFGNSPLRSSADESASVLSRGQNDLRFGCGGGSEG
jgi:hypothetical protein